MYAKTIYSIHFILSKLIVNTLHPKMESYNWQKQKQN